MKQLIIQVQKELKEEAEQAKKEKVKQMLKLIEFKKEQVKKLQEEIKEYEKDLVDGTFKKVAALMPARCWDYITVSSTGTTNLFQWWRC